MPYSWSSRAWAAGLPLTRTSPVVGSMRLAISRSSVDLPHPDGPIRLTNSPGATARSTSTSASTCRVVPGLNTLPAFVTSTAFGPATSLMRMLLAPAAVRVARGDLERRHDADHRQAEHRRAEQGGVHLGRVAGRLPGVLDDQPADAAAQAGRDLGDDDADHRRRRGQLQRRHHARHGGREAQLAHRLAVRWRRSCASARATSPTPTPARAACRRRPGRRRGTRRARRPTATAATPSRRGGACRPS